MTTFWIHVDTGSRLATATIKASEAVAFAGFQKSCGQLLGESWPRAIRSGTGRGGDVTGSRVSLFLCLVRDRGRAGGGNRRAAIAKRDPYVGIALRLTLDEAVAGLGPGHDVLILVVEDEFTLVGLHGQHGVAFAL